jgi:hypothetical protein
MFAGTFSKKTVRHQAIRMRLMKLPPGFRGFPSAGTAGGAGKQAGKFSAMAENFSQAGGTPPETGPVIKEARRTRAFTTVARHRDVPYSASRQLSGVQRPWRWRFGEGSR